MVIIMRLRELESTVRQEGVSLTDYGYKWVAKYNSFIRKEPYGYSIISFVLIDYNPKLIIIPHFSFSSKKVNTILYDVMQLKSDAASDSIIFNLGHFDIQTEFEVSSSEDYLHKVKDIFKIVIDNAIPLFNSIKSDFDIGEYVASRGGDISNVFSYMNAMAQHYEMLLCNTRIDPKEYFSSFNNRQPDIGFIEKYLAHTGQ